MPFSGNDIPVNSTSYVRNLEFSGGLLDKLDILVDNGDIFIQFYDQFTGGYLGERKLTRGSFTSITGLDTQGQITTFRVRAQSLTPLIPSIDFMAFTL